MVFCKNHRFFLSILLLVAGMSAAKKAAPKAPVQAQPTRLLKYETARGFGTAGGIYFKIDANDATLANKPKNPGNARQSFQIYLNNIKTQEFFVFYYQIGENQNQVNAVWLLPEGQYQVIRLSTVDRKGDLRRWVATVPQAPFQVWRGSVSNLGLWTVRAFGKQGLGFNMQMQPQAFEISELMKYSGGKPVINGYSKMMQTVSKYRSQLEVEETPRQTGGTTLAAYAYTRRINLQYTVELARERQLRTKFTETVRLYDANLRQCYNNGLAENGDLKGKVSFSFLLSKNTPHLDSLKTQKDELRSPEVLSCLLTELAYISFPIQKDISGVLTLNFKVKERMRGTN